MNENEQPPSNNPEINKGQLGEKFSSLKNLTKNPEELPKENPAVKEAMELYIKWVDQQQTMVEKAGTMEVLLQSDFERRILFFDIGYDDSEYMTLVIEDLAETLEAAEACGEEDIAQKVQQKINEMIIYMDDIIYEDLVNKKDAENSGDEKTVQQMQHQIDQLEHRIEELRKEYYRT